NGNARAVKEQPARMLATGQSSGARLTLSAHRGVPRLPQIDLSGQAMERAPALPQTLDSRPAAISGPTARKSLKPTTKLTTPVDWSPEQGRQLVPTKAQPGDMSWRTGATVSSAATAVQAIQPESAPNVPTDVITRLAAHQEQLATLHRAFLAHQAAVHQDFLALRQKQEATLLAAYGTALNRAVSNIA